MEKNIEAFFSNDTNLDDIIKDKLKTATSEVLICVYMINFDIYRDVLLELKEKGVEIKVVTDSTSWSNYTKKDVIDFEIKAANFKNSNGFAHNKNFLMHNKYCIIDQSLVITGSFNYTISAPENFENIVVINDYDTAVSFRDNFLIIYKNNSQDVGCQKHAVYKKVLVINDYEHNTTYDALIYNSIDDLLSGFVEGKSVNVKKTDRSKYVHLFYEDDDKTEFDKAVVVEPIAQIQFIAIYMVDYIITDPRDGDGYYGLRLIYKNMFAKEKIEDKLGSEVYTSPDEISQLFD